MKIEHGVSDFHGKSTRFTLLFCSGLAFIEYLIYFRANDHFFQGDSIYLFYHRHATISDFLASFVRLDSAGWYRPLTHRTVQSILYPFAGLEPPAYRIVGFVLFFAATLAAYKLAMTITERRLAACIATSFFSIHTVNAYTTYDVTMTHELVYTSFYICAVIAYLRGRLLMSVLCFIASLCSKESAITLPVLLVALDIILNRKNVQRAISRARGHFAVAAVYVAFVVGYLGVQRSAFQSIMERPGPEISYRFALDRTIATNLDHAMTWVFNIPRGWHTQWRGVSGWMLGYLKAFRTLVVLGALWLLFLSQRRLVLAGLAWFLVTIAPALPLFDHFLPYYLFLPAAGFSIMIGVVFDAIYQMIAAYKTALADFALAAPFAILLAICVVSIRNDMEGNRLLGWSSRHAQNSFKDLEARYPKLQPNTTIYISDAEDSNLAWDLAEDELFRMRFNDESIQTAYWSWGSVITKGMMDRGPLVVMKYHQFHLSDVTEEFLAASVPPVDYAPSDKHILSIAPMTRTTGESYRLSITGLPDTDVTIHYAVDGGPVKALAAHLDNHHEVQFDVSPQTGKGLYRFVGFRLPTGEWIHAGETLQIF